MAALRGDNNENQQSDNCYKNELLRKLNESRVKEESCDVTLIVGDRRFPCHRLILQAATDVFDAMLNHGFQEKEKVEIPLNNLNADIMEDILKYIYTGKIQITLQNAQEILLAADYLLLISLKTLAERFVAQGVMRKLESAFELLTFAVKYHCDYLKRMVFSVVLKNFMFVRNAPEFLELEEGMLAEILSSDEINVRDEEVIFDDLVRWVNHDPDIRNPKFPNLFKHVRLFYINPVIMRDKISKNELVLRSPECMSTVISTLCAIAPNQPMNNREFISPRKSLRDSVILLAGGNNCGQKNDKVLFWKTLTSMGQVTGCIWYKRANDNLSLPSFSNSVLLDYSLVLFGKHNLPECKTSVKFCDLNTCAVSTLSPMIKCRISFAVTVKGGVIYVIGGRGHNNMAVADVECYNTSTNSWSSLPSLAVPRIEATAVTCCGQIYCMGGYDGSPNSSYRSVERFNSNTNTWMTATPMNKPRRSASGCVLSDKIFITGGYHTTVNTSRCEMYDPSTLTWTVIASMNIARHFHAVTVLDDGRLCVLGGYDRAGNMLNSIEVRHRFHERWDVVSWKLPCSKANFQCFQVCLPKSALERINTAMN